MLDVTRLKAELNHIHRGLLLIGASQHGASIFHELRAATQGGTNAALVWQALFADCLRVVHAAIAADDEVRDEEVDAIYDMVFSVARHYAAAAPSYREYSAIDLDSVRPFLASYAADGGTFGWMAKNRWPGLSLCRRAAAVGERAPLERYERIITWLIDAACGIGGVDESDPRWQGRMTELAELRRELALASDSTSTDVDLRERAFLSSTRVFMSVQQASSVFDDDPWDVETVHADARATFERMVDRATTPSQHGDRGRMLLVLGDSGAGKTHLLRAFRRHVQEKAFGFVAYVQMQSNSEDYARYVLQHVVDSFAKPYAGPGAGTGLQELASGLHRLVGGSLGERVAGLRTSEDIEGVDEVIDGLVDDLLGESDLATFDPDLLRVLLHALRPNPRVTNRVYKYLRCEDMTAHDRKWIGGVAPRTGADDPSRMIRELGRLAWTTQQAALVLMVDQAELAGFEVNAAVTFRRAIDALHKVVSELPSSVAVIACLGDLYTNVRPQLTKSAIDRLENDPPPERLSFNRSYPEIQAIVAKRLAWLFAEHSAMHRAETPVYPIPDALLRGLVNRRTRDVLDECHAFQERCANSGRIVELAEASPAPPPPPPPSTTDLDRIAAAWNDAQHAAGIAIPDEEDAVLTLLVAGLRSCAVQTGRTIDVTMRDEHAIVTVTDGATTSALTIAVTDKGPQRRAFTNQVERLRAAAGSTTPVAVRTVPFPGGEVSSKTIAELLKHGGRRELLDEVTLRTLAAYQQFRPDVPPERIAEWERRDRPIAILEPIARILDLEPIAPPPPAVTRPVEPVPAKPAVPAEAPPTPTTAHSTTLHVGTGAGFRAEPKTIEMQSLVRHAGVLGTTGSGKTTLALNLVEQLLERDVAVVLVDRKGDLAGYAQPDWWERSADPERAQRLAAGCDVRLFTPGTAGGRPLSLSVIPDLAGVPAHDRSREVQHAAGALVGMMGFGEGSRDRARRALLVQAIETLAERRAPAQLEHVIELLETRDNDLVARVSRFSERLFESLVQDLETLRLNDGVWFDPSAEALTAEVLVGRRPDGKTPLSIVSTRFLGDIERVQSWVVHLIGTLNRHVMRAPTSHLQLVLMLDEADLYMPAVAKPPSKEPLQDLLRRSRAAGLGVLLASQSPADFDYRSRDLVNTWFVGTVREATAIQKLQALFEHRPAAAGKLATLEPGRFIMLQDGSVGELTRAPSLLYTTPLDEARMLALAAAQRR